MSATEIHDKAQVPASFDRVARRYDLLCKLNPGYRKHLAWSAARLQLGPSARILDLCCGTGLSTLALRRAYPDAEICGLDGSAEMLAMARTRPELVGVGWVEGDATSPRLAGVGGSFDGILMAYGIRNVSEPDRCLDAIFELLRPGGSVCFHEYSVASSLRSRLTWNLVASSVIVPLGRLATGSDELFRYLKRSVVEFDGVRAFEDRLKNIGFTQVETLAMDGWQRGVVHSFVARRPA